MKNEEIKKITTSVIKEYKKNHVPIAMLTAYDYPTALMLDEAGVDMLLVGDSLGNVVLGYESTTSVNMDDMLHHTKAVSRGAKRAMVVADMPFMSYQISTEEAVRNAGRLIQEGGAHAVKLEGGQEMQDVIHGIVRAGIPVVAHLGLTPQSVNQLGGYKVQAKLEKEAQKLMDDARAVEAAGAFSVVLECIPASLASYVTQNLSIPTIGIGAGAGCDGQVLVVHDAMGISGLFTPKFVKKFADLHQVMLEAAKSYVDEVKKLSFPREEHSFRIDESIIKKLY